jgi:hypothetical protein
MPTKRAAGLISEALREVDAYFETSSVDYEGAGL